MGQEMTMFVRNMYLNGELRGEIDENKWGVHFYKKFRRM